MDNKENRLIVEFMGLEKEIQEYRGEYSWSDSPFFYTNDSSKGEVFENIVDYSKYHTSYEWLMPVVEKIESLGYGTSFKSGYLRINPIEGQYYNYIVWLSYGKHGWYMNPPYVEDDEEDRPPFSKGDNKLTKIEAIYKVVVEFIKWYNENRIYSVENYEDFPQEVLDVFGELDNGFEIEKALNKIGYEVKDDERDLSGEFDTFGKIAQDNLYNSNQTI